MSDERTENKRRKHLRGKETNIKFTLQGGRKVGDLIAILLGRKRVELLNTVTDDVSANSSKTKHTEQMNGWQCKHKMPFVYRVVR